MTLCLEEPNRLRGPLDEDIGHPAMRALLDQAQSVLKNPLSYHPWGSTLALDLQRCLQPPMANQRTARQASPETAGELCHPREPKAYRGLVRLTRPPVPQWMVPR